MRTFLLTDSRSDTQIIIQRNSLDHLASYLKQLNKSYSQAVLISTEHLLHLYGEQVKNQLEKFHLPVKEMILANGEEAKTLQQVTLCWEKMTQWQLDRHSLVIALGGGTISDAAGFAAACYMRGIDTVFLPTTLLSMVDASIGGKTGINFSQNKNLIGAYHAPKLVIIDPCCLRTLPKRELKSGLAEIIKTAIIGDEVLFEELERNIHLLLECDLPHLETIIYRACKIKYDIICQDFDDTKDIRSHLNYGHTFAHALENLTHYKTYLHGEAVSIGMSCAAHLSRRMNVLDSLSEKRQNTLCLKAGLPIYLPSIHLIDPLVEAMKSDKKAIGGKINLILPQKIGKVFRFSNIDQTLLKQTLLTQVLEHLERT